MGRRAPAKWQRRRSLASDGGAHASSLAHSPGVDMSPACEERRRQSTELFYVEKLASQGAIGNGLERRAGTRTQRKGRPRTPRWTEDRASGQGESGRCDGRQPAVERQR